jgi:hypothetical protein
MTLDFRLPRFAITASSQMPRFPRLLGLLVCCKNPFQLAQHGGSFVACFHAFALGSNG